VNIPGSTCFKESNAMSPGNTLNTFQMGKLKVGLGICHDMRFSEMAALYQKQGLSLFIANKYRHYTSIDVAYKDDKVGYTTPNLT